MSDRITQPVYPKNAQIVTVGPTLFGPSFIQTRGAGTVQVITEGGQTVTFATGAGLEELPVMCVAVLAATGISEIRRTW